MSALLFALRRAEIIVLADTRAAGYARVGKVFPIVHVPALMCVRGPLGLLIESSVRIAAVASNFDQLTETIPAQLDAVVRANIQNIAQLPERDRRIELYVAGISPSTSRSRVLSYLLTDSEGSTAVYEHTDESGDFILCAPWIADLGPVPEISSGMLDTELRALLRSIHQRQIGLMNSRWAEGSGGGRRVTVTVTERSVISEIADE